MKKIMIGLAMFSFGMIFPGVIHYNHVQGQKVETEQTSLIQELNKHDAMLVKMGEVNANLERMVSLQAVIEGIPESERNYEGYEELQRTSNIVKKNLRKMDKTQHKIMNDEFVRSYPKWRKDVMEQVKIIERYVEKMENSQSRE